MCDKDTGKIRRLVNGDVPIYEPGLRELVQRNLADDRLRFTNDLDEAVSAAQVILIAVGTPSNPDGSVDLTYPSGEQRLAEAEQVWVAKG